MNSTTTIIDTDGKIQEAIKTYNDQLQPTNIVVGIRPKRKSRNKFIQWLLIKLFGYELEYKTVMAKTVMIKAEDYPISANDDLTFTIDCKGE